MSDRCYVDLQLEKAILGAIVSGREDSHGATAAASALPLLSLTDFGDRAHQVICDAAISALRAGGVSPVAVTAALRAAGTLNTAGGDEYVVDLPFYGLNAGDPVFLVARLKEIARARRVVEAAERITRASAIGASASRFLEVAQQDLEEALSSAHTTAGFESAAEGLERVYVACENREPQRSWSTGMKNLDWLLGGGIYAGTLNVFAARPGVGKTSLATQVAYTVAATQKAPCLMFSLEMPPLQIWERLMAGRAHVPHSSIRRRETEVDKHHVQMAAVVESARKVPFYIHKRRRGERKPLPEEMMAIARGFRQKHGDLAVLVVDYVQIAVPPGAAPKNERIGAVTEALKDISVELECAVIGISQFNRGAANERPDISQLAGSGSIESDADSIVMLYKPDQKVGKVEAIVGKNRSGGCGSQWLNFIDDEVRFEESA
jgi:replicative DNA helicase